MTDRPAPSPCPPESVLRQLGSTLIDSDQFVLIDTHVEHCNACQAYLEGLVRQMGVQTMDGPDQVTRDPAAAVHVPGYELIKKLGHGAMGEVYLATQQKTERPVALKCVPGGWTKGRECREQWLSEARAVARINHPNVVRLYAIEETSQHYVLVFEYVAGGTLEQRITETVPPKEAAGLIIQIARAVEEIHGAGLLHLDLKPANVLIEGNAGRDWGEITLKVADFGISQKSEQSGTADQSRHRRRGTPGYMAPEQNQPEQARLDRSTDIYSLGIIFYELLTGQRSKPKPPQFGPEDVQRFQKSGLIDKSLSRKQFEALIRICQKCLNRLQSDRYQTATELLADLRSWQESLNHDRVAGQRKALRKYHRLLIGPLAALLLLGPLMSQLWVLRSPDFPEPVRRMTREPLTRSQWIEMLTNRQNALLADDLPWLLQQTQQQAGQAVADREMPVHALVTLGTLVKSFSNRLNANLNKDFLRNADDFLETASLILQECMRRAPLDPLVLHEYVMNDMDYCYLHVGSLDNSAKTYETSIQAMLKHLNGVAGHIDRIQDEPVRTVHQTRLLDFCRYHVLILELQGLPHLSRQVRHLEQLCLKEFEKDQDKMEIQARIRLARNEYPFPDGIREAWNTESADRLQMEWISSHLHSRMPDDDQNEANFFQQFRNEIEILGMDSETIPKAVFYCYKNLVVSVSTYCRANRQISRAEWYQRRFQRLSHLLVSQFPTDPYAHMTLSEAHLQVWKNQLRRDRPDTALAALMESQKAASHASMVAPDLLLARELAEDRQRRIALFRADQVKEKRPVISLRAVVNN
ncbi:MAG: Serine/threonine-protein kinase PrkC [Planctomycetota bacterium]